MNNTPNMPDQQYVQVMDANGALHFVPAQQLIPVADASGKVEYKPAYAVQYVAQQYVQVMDSAGRLQTVPAQQLIPVTDAAGRVEYKPAYTVQWSQPTQPAFNQAVSAPAYAPSYIPTGTQSANVPLAAPSYTPTIVIAQADEEDLEEEIPEDAPTEPRKALRRRCSRAGAAVIHYILISEFATLLALLIFALPTIIAGMRTPEVAAAMADSFGAGYNAIIEYIADSDWYQNYFFISLLASTVGAICASTIPFFIFAKRCGTVTEADGSTHRELKPFSFYGKGKYVPGLILKGFVFGIATSFTWSLLYTLLCNLLPNSGISESTMGLEFPIGDAPSMILYAARVCLLAPILEEFMFRGVLLKGLSKYGNGFAVAVTAILFGLLHGNAQQTPFAAIIGVVLGYIAVRTGNIWSSMAVHCLINSFSTIMTFVLAAYGDSAFIIGLVGVFALVIEIGCVIAAIVLLARANINNKIKWRPVDKERCCTLMPKVRTEAKKKMLNCLSSLGVVVCILACIGLILNSFGVFYKLFS